MARAHHDRRTPGDWLRGLFRQPPPGFYSRPAVYLSGDRMEIEHFCTVLFFDENKLCLRLAKGRFTVYGSGLRICTLTAARLTVQGQFLRTDFPMNRRLPWKLQAFGRGYALPPGTAAPRRF